MSAIKKGPSIRQIGKKYRKNLASLAIAAAVCAAVLAGHFSGRLDRLEFMLYDLRLNLFKDSSRRSDDVIVVLLDQHSLDWGKTERGWGWPWPRKAYADFVDYLNLGQASSVVFDVLFSEPSVHLSYRPLEKIDEAARGLVAAREAAQAGQAAQTYFDEVMGVLETLRAGEDDAAFAEAAERSGRVVQGVFFSTVTGALREWPAGLSTPLFRPQGFDEIIDLFSLEHDGNAGAQFPIESLRASAGALGSVTGTEDSDGTFRRMRLFTLFDGRAVPTLSAAALFAAGGMPAEITFDPRRRAIQWGGFTIPVDSDGKTLLRFRGALERYPQHSMSAILQSAADHAAGREPTFPPEDFKGAHVFVGFYAPGLFDIFATPVSPLYPGVGVHVTMMDNMLMGDFITRAPDWIALAMIAAAVVAMTLLVLYSGKAGRSAGGLAAALLAIVVAGLVAFNSGLWIPMATPLLAALLAFFSATFYSYATEGRDKRFIKNAFSRILSPKVIDQIIADPTQLKLGGERRKMTAMFTDIQRFSTISSVLQDKYGEDGPKVLVNLLNLYLTEMSDIVLGNGGTIDKYEGDAIIAFFGAPAWMENHAALACRSAVQMKKREKQLVEKIMNPDGEFHGPLSRLIDSNVVRRERPLYTRLGINTGDMVVGFMGTPAKMDYTIMGNAVNLTARLEGVNKQYDTQGILISEYTRDQLGQEFIVRPLSRVTVVGIPAPLRLYELLDIREEAPPELIKATENWEKAFAAYEGRNFAWAQKAFAELRRLNPEDSVAKFYAERCARYQAEPVSADWDGVDNLTEK